MSSPAVIKAFAAALGEVQTIKRDQTADTGKYTYSYADINSILRMLKPILERHGLAIAQPLNVDPQGLTRVETVLIDIKTGESETWPGPGFPTKGDPQAAGSAITYFRRYSIVSLFSLEAADDDGKAAHVHETNPNERTPAEVETRAIIAGLDPEVRKQFIADFRAQFGSSLTELPTSRHGDALTFAKNWGFDTAEPTP